MNISRQRRETSGSLSGSGSQPPSPSFRHSFGASVRLNDLINSEDDYGFAEEASEASIFLAEEGDGEIRDGGKEAEKKMSPTAISNSDASISNGSQTRKAAVANINEQSEGPSTSYGNVSEEPERRSLGGLSQGSTEDREGGGEREKTVAEYAPLESTSRSPETQKKEKRSPSLTERISAAAEASLGTQTQPSMLSIASTHLSHLPFATARYYTLGVLIALTFASPGFVVGMLWGMYISSVIFLFFFVSDPRVDIEEKERTERKREREEDGLLEERVDEVAAEAMEMAAKEENVVYRGWMNELRSPIRYSPSMYHVNSCRCVLVRLDADKLRISRPARAVLKHAFHADPTLTQPQPTMTSQAIYDLKNATVSLRPRRLARRRWWSRKYPIYIKFGKKAELPTGETRGRSGSLMKRSVSMHPSKMPHVSSDVMLRPSVSIDDGAKYESSSSDSDDDGPSSSHNGSSRSMSMGRTRSTTELSTQKEEEEKEIEKKKETAEKPPRGIFLFARAAREKERWYHLLREACAQACVSSKLDHPSSSKPIERKTIIGSTVRAASVYGDGPVPPPRRRNLPDTVSLPGESEKDKEKPAKDKAKERHDRLCEYEKYRRNRDDFAKWKPGAVPDASSDLVAAINAIGTRIFFDFCRDAYWCRQVKEKMQTKLATVHLPYFIEQLELSSLTLGTAPPHIESVYAPTVDQWGLWIDFEMKYSGGIRLTLETRINLLRLKAGTDPSVPMPVAESATPTTWLPPAHRAPTRYSDEDLPESPEDSPDEDFGAKTNNSDGKTGRESAGSRIINLVERAAQTALFQKAARLPKVAKMMTELSETRLQLNVEIEQLEGTMTVNLPGPPSDRIWYAFRRRPTVSIKAVPQVGDRSVDFSAVSDWIESRLKLLLEKNLVCPNMDDVIIPVMSGNDLLNMGYNM